MNKVVHFEVPAEDMARAKKFYEEAFGWSLMSWDPKYFIATTGPTEPQKGPSEPGFINGGIAERMADVFTAPTIVMGADDIDEAVRKVEVAGGSLVTPKYPIGEMGFYARVKDSEGNIVGIWETVKK